MKAESANVGTENDENEGDLEIKKRKLTDKVGSSQLLNVRKNKDNSSPRQPELTTKLMPADFAQASLREPAKQDSPEISRVPTISQTQHKSAPALNVDMNKNPPKRRAVKVNCINGLHRSFNRHNLWGTCLTRVSGCVNPAHEKSGNHKMDGKCAFKMTMHDFQNYGTKDSTKDVCPSVEAKSDSGSEDDSNDNITCHVEPAIERCIKCKESFQKPPLFTQHLYEIHVGICSECSTKCASYAAFLKHVSVAHDKSNSEISIKQIDNITSKDHQCTLCKIYVSSKRMLKRHYYWFHGTYSCDFCPFMFTQVDREENHFNKNHLLQCSKCHVKFETQNQLSDHETSSAHAQTECHVCEHCGSVFKQRGLLIIHRRVHNEEYLCEHCGHVEQNKLALMAHKKFQHQKYPEKICPHSKKSFLSLHLNKCFNSSANIDDFKCEYCKNYWQHFTQQHVLSRHSTYKCQTCNMEFLQQANLNLHIKELHELRPKHYYKCKFCKTVLKISDIKSHHKSHSSQVKGNHSRALLTKIKILYCDFCDNHFASRALIQTHMQTHLLKNVNES